MLDRTEQHIMTILDLSDRLAAVAQAGYSAFDDDSSLLLNGVVRDCAFRLRDAVEMKMKSREARVPTAAIREVR
jgi:hypothetical protein